MSDKKTDRAKARRDYYDRMKEDANRPLTPAEQLKRMHES